MKIIECVPNVSEGRDRRVLEQIAAAVEGVEGVELLDVDPGAETNRTVFTFVGGPEALAVAALAFARKATELIDMTHHKGAHSRMGAVDVMPFVPVGGGATMDDCVTLARLVGQRLGEELGIPIYLYEHAASRPERRNLAQVRKGEYEGLADKLADPEWKPDFGPASFVPRSGATAVGARPFLIAYNVDLNTADRKLAHDVALDVREQGRLARDEHGKILRDAQGNKLRKPGKHKAVRAVGWYIPEFGRAQVSINLTDYRVTAPHQIFDSIREEARKRGLRVTGSEVVGLIPLEAVRMAGGHYLDEQGKTTAVPEPDLVDNAVSSLGLNDVKPFDPAEAIIDYRLAPREEGLRGMSLTAFADELSRSTPAPGGGSVAALVGSMGAALVSMVAALTHSGARDSAEMRDTLAALGEQAQTIKDELLRAIDADTQSFEGIGAARRLPRKTPEQQAVRARRIVEATRGAIEVPLAVVEKARDLADLARQIARIGLPAAASDAGVAAWCARCGAEGAALNVRINVGDLPDPSERSALLERLEQFLGQTRRLADEALALTEERISEEPAS